MDQAENNRRGKERRARPADHHSSPAAPQRDAEKRPHENAISAEIIGAAIEVHRELGPGLIESIYQAALCRELQLRGVQFSQQGAVSINYKGVKLGTDLRFDLLVESRVIVDLKTKDQVLPIDKQKVLTYLRLLDLHLGLLINFHVEILKNGVSRVVNRLCEPPELEDRDPPDLRA